MANMKVSGGRGLVVRMLIGGTPLNWGTVRGERVRRLSRASGGSDMCEIFNPNVEGLSSRSDVSSDEPVYDEEEGPSSTEDKDAKRRALHHAALDSSR